MYTESVIWAFFKFEKFSFSNMLKSLIDAKWLGPYLIQILFCSEACQQFLCWTNKSLFRGLLFSTFKRLIEIISDKQTCLQRNNSIIVTHVVTIFGSSFTFIWYLKIVRCFSVQIIDLNLKAICLKVRLNCWILSNLTIREELNGT